MGDGTFIELSSGLYGTVAVNALLTGMPMRLGNRSEEVRNAKVRVRSLAAAQAHICPKHHLTRKKKREAAAKSLMQIAKIQVAACERDFSSVVEEQKTDRADDPPVEFCLHEK